MSKIKLKATLGNLTDQEQTVIESVGIQNGNHICYLEKDIQMHLWINKNEIKMKRIQKDAKLKCQFIKSLTTEGIYDIKSINISIPVQIKTKELWIDNQTIEIKYIMTFADTFTKEFCYLLKYEVIS